MRIQYGGSVTPDSVDDLMAKPGEGGGVRGASAATAHHRHRTAAIGVPQYPMVRGRGVGFNSPPQHERGNIQRRRYLRIGAAGPGLVPGRGLRRLDSVHSRGTAGRTRPARESARKHAQAVRCFRFKLNIGPS